MNESLTTLNRVFFILNILTFFYSYKICYNTGSSLLNGEVPEVPQFVLSVHKSTKQLGLSFAYNAPEV